MASTATGSVTNNLAGTQLTYTDTGSYGAVSSRVLTIYDFNNTLLATIIMGSSLSAVYNIAADGYYKFVCTVTDNLGTVAATVTIVAEGKYVAAFLNTIQQIGCSSNCSTQLFEDLLIGELFLAASERFGAASSPVLAQNNITAANLYINS